MREGAKVVTAWRWCETRFQGSKHIQRAPQTGSGCILAGRDPLDTPATYEACRLIRISQIKVSIYRFIPQMISVPTRTAELAFSSVRVKAADCDNEAPNPRPTHVTFLSAIDTPVPKHPPPKKSLGDRCNPSPLLVTPGPHALF